jgi:hypothetical protein
MITAEFINSKKKVYSMDFDGLDSFHYILFSIHHTIQSYTMLSKVKKLY